MTEPTPEGGTAPTDKPPRVSLLHEVRDAGKDTTGEKPPAGPEPARRGPGRPPKAPQPATASAPDLAKCQAYARLFFVLPWQAAANAFKREFIALTPELETISVDAGALWIQENYALVTKMGPGIMLAVAQTLHALIVGLLIYREMKAKPIEPTEKPA